MRRSKRVVRVVLVAMTAVCASANAAAQSREWRISQHPLGCAIVGTDEEENSAALLYIRPFRGSASVKIVSRNADGPMSVGTKTGSLRIAGSAGFPVTVSWAIMIDPKKSDDREQIAIIDLDGQSEQRFRNGLSSASEAQIAVENKVFGVKTPSAAIWQQTDQCLAQVGAALLASAPPANHDGSVPDRSKPVPRMMRPWFSESSYPSEAVKLKAQGDTRAEVTADRYGYPIACRIVQSSGFTLLDDRTCTRLLNVAHFYPALNKDGQAVDGKWEMTVRWRAP